MEAAMVLAAALLLVGGQVPERLEDGHLWAEDVSTYLKQGYEMGIASLPVPAAGYINAVPRTIVLAFSQIGSPAAAVLVFPWICAGLLALCSCYLFLAMRRDLGAVAATAFALAYFMVPQDGEVWLNITNLQWIMAPVLLVLLWSETGDPHTGFAPARIARAVAIAFLTLTGPFGIIFLPFAALMLAVPSRRPRDLASRLVLAVYAIGVAIQLTLVLTTPDLSQRSSLDVFVGFDWTEAFLRYGFLDLLLGRRWTDALEVHWYIVGLGFSLLYLAIISSARGQWRAITLALAVLACLFWLIGRIRFVSPDIPMRSMGGSRYLFIPFVLVAWSLCIAAAKSGPFGHALAPLMLVAIIANSIDQLSIPPLPATQITQSVDDDGVLYTITPPPGAPFSATIRSTRQSSRQPSP